MASVLITGANRGIGLEFARQYAADSWDVVATVRQSSAELEALRVRIETLDMQDLDVIAGFGSRVDRLDLMIANAGVMSPEQAETGDDGRGWTAMLVTNCIAPYLLAKALLPRMTEPCGKLIALSSGMGSIAESSGGYVPYRTSKAALNMAWHSLAVETRKRGIIAAVIDPGWVQTRMGGPHAPTPPEHSVADMRLLIEQLAPEQSGSFLKRDGTRHAW